MRATDPTMVFIGYAFEFFIIFVMVWLVLFFMALPIGMGKEEETGRGADVKKKLLYSALVSLVIGGIIYWITKSL